jgi:hypothetical protein
VTRPGSFAALVATVIVLLVPMGCAGDDKPAVTASADHSGLTLEVSLRPTGGSLRAETVLRNTRDTEVHLDATQCGRATEVILARTAFEPEGQSYTGSLDAVKQLVLRQQRSNQIDDSFAPRRGPDGSEVPECVRPTQPVTIPPGGMITESWELPFTTAYGLAEVGTAHMDVRAAAVESVAADKLGFIDVLPPGQADEARQGRVVSAATPASAVLDRAPTRPNTDPSLGQRFDTMIGAAAIRSFIAAQPADSWRRATITPTAAGPWEFRAVTTGFERAMRVDLAPDGSVVGSAEIPTAQDRARVFERRPATLPPGIAVIPEPDTPTLTDDVVAGHLSLPSGRVVADSTLIGTVESMSQVAAPGAYPVFVTVGRLPGAAEDQVAFASLVVSDSPTVSWVPGTTVAVDGGTAAFTSAEGSARLAGLGETANLAAVDAAFDSLTAHDDLITEVPIGEGTDLAMFASGYGDGTYGVYVGLDADGRPTRYVMDFAIVHLGWP